MNRINWYMVTAITLDLLCWAALIWAFVKIFR